MKVLNMKNNIPLSQKLSLIISIILFILQFLLLTISSYSQISLSSSPKTADNSAILDISGSTTGVLINRMNTAQRDAITPDANAVSLMIFNTDTKCLEAYVNGGWYNLSCPDGCIPPSAPVALNADVACKSFKANWNASPGAFSYYLDVSSDIFITFVSGYNNLYVGNVTSFNVTGLSSNTNYYYRVRAATSCISGNSNVKQAVIPVTPSVPTAGTSTYTTNSITWNWNVVSGATGYQWNTSSTYPGDGINVVSSPTYTQTGISCGNTYNFYVWSYSATCHSPTPLALALTLTLLSSGPTAGTNVPSIYQIVWNWNTVSGATGYQWNTTNTYPGSGNHQVSTSSYTQTGLFCNTAYTLYVWAYNTCGPSNSYSTLSQTTSTCQNSFFYVPGCTAQTWTVPLGVSSITVTVKGAGGGAGSGGGAGGGGASIQNTLSVTPGTILYLYIGGQGQTGNAGCNGGGGGAGDVYGWSSAGGGGGGASDIRIGGTALSNRVVVAGGGGGGGGYTGPAGGNGGYPDGQNGLPSYTHYGNTIPGTSGGGGTQSGGGAGGIAGNCWSTCVFDNGQAGALGQGGNGGPDGAGGGGAGYFGGGGGGGGQFGGGSASGGGGSSWTQNGSGSLIGYNSVHGQIVISY
jgi:hypothetical protein